MHAVWGNVGSFIAFRVGGERGTSNTAFLGCCQGRRVPPLNEGRGANNVRAAMICRRLLMTPGWREIAILLYRSIVQVPAALKDNVDPELGEWGGAQIKEQVGDILTVP